MPDNHSLTSTGMVDGRPVRLLRHKIGEWAEVWFLDTNKTSIVQWNEYTKNPTNTNQRASPTT